MRQGEERWVPRREAFQSRLTSVQPMARSCDVRSGHEMAPLRHRKKRLEAPATAEPPGSGVTVRRLLSTTGGEAPSSEVPELGARTPPCPAVTPTGGGALCACAASDCAQAPHNVPPRGRAPTTSTARLSRPGPPHWINDGAASAFGCRAGRHWPLGDGTRSRGGTRPCAHSQPTTVSPRLTHVNGAIFK